MNRAQKDFAASLGIKLQAARKAMEDATGNDENQHAAIQMGILFNTHIQAIIWFLKDAGGVKQLPLVKRKTARPKLGTEHPPVGPDPELPRTPDILALPACQCEPLEPGIIGSKHMASCPHYG